MEQRERKWYDGSANEWDSVFDLPINMRPSKPSYSRSHRPKNHFWETRQAYALKDIDVFNWGANDTLTWWKITDIIKIGDVSYYMRIWWWNIRIYQSTDWCTLKRIVTDCYCWNAKRFSLTNFVKWKPKTLYGSTIKWVNGVQYNDIANWTGQWQFSDAIVNAWWTYNINNWITSILAGDYIYTYSWWYVYNVTCDDKEQLKGWICWQVRQINCNSDKKINVNALWSWFDQWASVGSVITRPAQTQWENMNYYVFWETWPTFIYPSCNWANVFHYYDDVIWAITTPMCNFQGCYSDIEWYNSGFGRLNVFYNKAKNNIVYSQPNLWWAYIESYYDVEPETNGIAQFQNYIIYFSPTNIGAMYIQENNWAFIGNWKVVRNNFWCWTNRWNVSESFDERDNGFYFLWTNKEIYWLSIVSNQWELVSKIESIHETRGKEIYGELQWLVEWDDVFIQWDNDMFTVFINQLSGGTKILRYWRRYKKRSIDEVCCAKIQRNVYDNYLWDWVYHLCSYLDCNQKQIISKMRWYFWENWEGVNSMTQFILWPLILQLGKETKANKLYINIYSERNSYKPVLTLDLSKLEYFKNIQDIRNWIDVTPSRCYTDKLKPCEQRQDGCKWEIKPVSQKYNCSCKEIIDDLSYCFCYQDKTYFMSDFINVLSELDIKGSLFYFELVCQWKMSFWGYTQWFFRDPDYKKRFNDCEIIRCTDCDKKEVCCVWVESSCN